MKNDSVPLFLFDRGISDKNFNELVTGDNMAIGTMAGKYMEQQLNENFTILTVIKFILLLSCEESVQIMEAYIKLEKLSQI